MNNHEVKHLNDVLNRIGLNAVIEQVFEFTDNDGNTFKWNINRVKEMLAAKPHTVFRLPYDQVEKVHTQKNLELIVDKDYAMTTNLELPIIIAQHPLDRDTQIIIDGCHRLYKAYRLKQDMPCVVLTLTESTDSSYYHRVL